MIALHPDGVQRHHGEWRVSSLDEPESNLRVEQWSCADGGVRLSKTWLQDVSGCAISQRLALCGMQRILPTTLPDTVLLVATTKRLLDTGADDARDDHESKRHKDSDDTVPMAQEPCSSSGVKRSNIEAFSRADAEAEKAVPKCWRNDVQRNEHPQHRWMNWRSLRRTQRYQLKR